MYSPGNLENAFEWYLDHHVGRYIFLKGEKWILLFCSPVPLVEFFGGGTEGIWISAFLKSWQQPWVPGVKLFSFCHLLWICAMPVSKECSSKRESQIIGKCRWRTTSGDRSGFEDMSHRCLISQTIRQWIGGESILRIWPFFMSLISDAAEGWKYINNSAVAEMRCSLCHHEKLISFYVKES